VPLELPNQTSYPVSYNIKAEKRLYTVAVPPSQILSRAGRGDALFEGWKMQPFASNTRFRL